LNVAGSRNRCADCRIDMTSPVPELMWNQSSLPGVIDGNGSMMSNRAAGIIEAIPVVLNPPGTLWQHSDPTDRRCKVMTPH